MVERRIPDTWFRAQASARPIGYIAGAIDRGSPLAEGERSLGPFVLPPFQRPPVWVRDQQISFIESCWLGLPIGAYVVNLTGWGQAYDLWLIDGQQRITAIVEYMADAFPVFGYRYSELTVVDHRMWHMSCTFTCLETQIRDEAELRDVYHRLAYGGTPHDPAQGMSAGTAKTPKTRKEPQDG